MRELLRLFDLFFDICLLRKGPEDVPSSPWLLRLLLVVYFALGSLLSLFEFGPFRALLLSGLDILLLVFLALSMLHLAGKRERLTQTLEGLFGIGVVLNLLALPVIAVIHMQGAGESPGLLISLAYLLLLFWSLLATGHVFGRALSKPLPLGVLIAITYMLMSIFLAQSLIVQTS